VLKSEIPTGTVKKPSANVTISGLRRAFQLESVRNTIKEAYDIPLNEEVLYDPENSWMRLGNELPAPVTDEILVAAQEKFNDVSYRLLNILCEKAETGAVSYKFIYSELLKAFQNGWLLEIQEAASILRPGVLTELNSLLEPNGSIELPNGERIFRHPDTIVVFTTNSDYAGNVELNESLRDRCLFGLKMDNPSADEMAARAMAQVDFKDKTVALNAANVICEVSSKAKELNIRGAFGMRSLISWLIQLKAGFSDKDTFLECVIYKMTTNDDDVSLLVEAYNNSPFNTTKFKRTV
jgi:hypothetical protein